YLDRFKFFILHHSSFIQEEKDYILKSLDDETTQRRFKVSLLLFSWTIVSFFIESFLIGGGFILSLIHGIDWRYFLPELSFIFLNFFAKFFYIRWYMNKN